MDKMREDQGAVAGQVDIDDLDIRLAPRQIVLF